MTRIVIAFVLATVAGVLAACGGDDGGPTPPPAGTAAPSPVATATPRATHTPATPAASATPAPTAVSGAGQFAYFGAEGVDIWLVNADGSGQRRLTDGQCQQAEGPFWSPRGDKIACVSGSTAPNTKIVVFDLEGRTVAEAEHEAWRGGFAWSADDRHFAYSISEGETPETARPVLVIADTESEAVVRLEDAQDARWSPDGAQLAYLKVSSEESTIYDLASGETRALGQGLRPLSWALRGKSLLVAANYQPQDIGATYEANLLDLAGGQMTRVPELDDGAQLWLSRDGQAAAFLAGPAERTEGGATIAILDLATRDVTAIDGAVIGYPSEGIPPEHVTFSADGSYLYWVDVVARSGQELSGTTYRARSDGSGVTQLGVLQAILFSFSPDRTMVLYFDGNALWVAGVDGSGARSLAEGVGVRWPPAAWRPEP